MTGRPTQPQTFLMHSKKATTANSDMASQEIHMLRFGPAEHPHAHNTCAPVSRPAQSLAYESPAVPYTMGLRQTLVCSVSRHRVLPHAHNVRSGVTCLAKPCLRASDYAPLRRKIGCGLGSKFSSSAPYRVAGLKNPSSRIRSGTQRLSIPGISPTNLRT